jgi:hypothetical protein
VASDNAALHEAGMLILDAYRAVVVSSSELTAVWRAARAAPTRAST